jgi:hypothetical protein
VDKVKSIFYGSERSLIMAAGESSGNVRLMSVETAKEAKTALQIIAERLAFNDVVYMPTKEEIQAKIEQNATRYRHLTGKKTHGHGGS